MSELTYELRDIASKTFEHPEHGACINSERLICGEAADRIEELEKALIEAMEWNWIDGDVPDGIWKSLAKTAGLLQEPTP